MKKTVIPIKRKKPVTTKSTIPEFKPYLSFDSDGCVSRAIDLSKGLDPSDSQIYYHDRPDNVYYFMWDLNDLPFCCGIMEIGQLSLRKEFPKNILKGVLDAFVFNQKFTFVINTNGKDSSIQVEAALKECKNWTLVKTFESPNTKNTIKMWVSNN